ncbi:MAG: radical SAM protein [Patescibacteria group bacterium]
MISKKVALISLYSRGVKDIPPLACLYLATALKKNGFDAKIIHEDANNYNKVVSDVEAYKPDLVGMSVFTGYNNKKYVELSRLLKKKDYKIMWGNAHPSLLPREVLAEPSIDFIAIGEGEETLVELVDNLDSPEKYNTILGLGLKDESGNIIINKRRDFIDIDKYLIDWSLINIESYLKPYFSGRYKRALAVTTSRGCPFNCQFCYNLEFNNRRWRGHSPEKMVENLKPIIEKYKIDALRILDDNFFVNKKRAFEIVSKLNLPYFAEARIDYVDQDFVDNLIKTKCQEIMFGFESGSERILKEVVKKGFDQERIIKAIEMLKDSGIMVSGSIVFGFPTETKEEYKMSMEFIVKLLDINNNLAFTCGWFLPYPGTGLYKKAKELGFKQPEKIEEWDKFDRWRNDYEMEWIDWDYKLAVRYSRKIVHLLALAYKRNIPIIKRILKWRVKNLNFSFPIDIYLFSRLRNIYLFSGDKSYFNKLIRKIVKIIIKIKK